MYAGRIVEEGTVDRIFQKPLHPYTKGLIDSIPHLEYDSQEKLYSIPGSVPTLQQMPKGCRFHTRCPHVTEKCISDKPPHISLDNKPDHKVRCWLYETNQQEGIYKEEREVHV